MTTNYVVYRHGRNILNQSTDDKRAICIVKAENETEAEAIGRKYHKFYPEQTTSAVPQDEVPDDVRKILRNFKFCGSGKDHILPDNVVATTELMSYYFPRKKQIKKEDKTNGN